jgi:hypothetical protein
VKAIYLDLWSFSFRFLIFPFFFSFFFFFVFFLQILFAGEKAIGVEIVAYNQQAGIPTTSPVTCNVYANTIVVSAGAIGK